MALGASLSEPVVGVFEEIARVDRDLQPGRIDRLDDAQHALGRAAQAPVVLQAEHDAQFLRLGHAAS